MVIVVDTDVFIAAIRGNEIAQQLLRKYSKSLALSSITICELYVGAKDVAKKKIVDKIATDHEILDLNKAISVRAIKLLKAHNTPTKQLFIPDALIAATCLENKAKLLTFNTKDFKFIKGIRFAN